MLLPWCYAASAVERSWNISASQGQILGRFYCESLFELFPSPLAAVHYTHIVSRPTTPFKRWISRSFRLFELPPYTGTSLIRNRIPLGPCRRPMPRVVGGS